LDRERRRREEEYMQGWEEEIIEVNTKKMRNKETEKKR
jgi:hypothetical protein